MATTSNPPKPRKNVCLSSDTLKKAEAIRKADSRNSLSNVIEALINEEHERRFPAGDQASGGKLARAA